MKHSLIAIQDGWYVSEVSEGERRGSELRARWRIDTLPFLITLHQLGRGWLELEIRKDGNFIRYK